MSEALADNPSLLTYRYIEKIAPNLDVLMVPSNAPLIMDMGNLGGIGSVSQSPGVQEVFPVEPTSQSETDPLPTPGAP